jgi:threonylcarbamoyladenosine tRNA methylthiotransferase MtaB
MSPTFYSFSFGCRVNEAEKVVLDKKLLALDFKWDEQHPDFYIINSCAVTGKAEREVRQHIYQTRKKFPKTIIVVTGCAATSWKQQNIHIQEINYLIENTKKDKIPEILSQGNLNSSQNNNTNNSTNTINTNDKFIASGRKMIKIQDGCDRYCSYCIVAKLRGKPQSKTIENIINEIQANESETQEIILTAINTACFGKDTGETLIGLIQAILKNTTIPVISFGSIHPWSITDEFLSFYTSILSTNRFLPFFHIPIQSGSDTILRLMNRGYTSNEMKQTMQNIKKINPSASIGTDIIVGFPGETDREFQETYEFLQNAPIDKIHVFRFSPRIGTAAEKLKKIYKEPTSLEKKERSEKLIKLQKLKTSLRTTT